MHPANAALFRDRPRFLAALDVAPAAYRIEKARSGAPVAVRISDDRRLGSRYDPARDAVRWAAGHRLRDDDLPLLVGFHPSLIEAIPRRPLLVVENDPSLLRAWLEEVDLASTLEGVTVWLDDDGFRTMSAVRNAFDPFTYSCVRVLPSPFSENAAWVKKIAEAALHIQRELSLNALSYACQLPKWLATAQSNLATWLDGPDGRAIEGALAGETAVLVGAGPSLDRNVADLRALAGRALIVVVDTALRRIASEGIMPDVVVAVDANDANALDVEGLSGEVLESVLAADTIAAPAIVRAFRGPRVLFRSLNYSYDLEDRPLPMIQPLDALLGEISGRDAFATWQSGGSVSTNALCLIHFLGIRRVILVGQDLAFTSGRAHASGVGHEETGIARFDRFQSREMIERRIVGPGQVRVDGWNGGRVATSEVMREYLRWFEMTIERGFGRDMDVIDATEGGARKKGARPMTLAEAATLVATGTRPGERLRARLASAPRAGTEGWRDRLKELRLRATTCLGDPDRIASEWPLARWLALAAYMGSRGMPTETRDALVRAAHRSAGEFIVTALGKRFE
jgi:hypothetical protein